MLCCAYAFAAFHGQNREISALLIRFPHKTSCVPVLEGRPRQTALRRTADVVCPNKLLVNQC